MASVRERLRRAERQVFVRRVFLLGLLVVGVACSSSHDRSTTTTTTPTLTVTSSPLPSCPASSPLAAGGQQIVPVQVPCGCPTATITAAPATDDAQAAGTAAALRWIRVVNPLWRNGLVRRTAFYRVGEVTNGEFSEVFASNVPRYCGKTVAEASYGVEMVNPNEADTGSKLDVAVAHFRAGWQVWGSYHP